MRVLVAKTHANRAGWRSSHKHRVGEQTSTRSLDSAPHEILATRTTLVIAIFIGDAQSGAAGHAMSCSEGPGRLAYRECRNLARVITRSKSEDLSSSKRNKPKGSPLMLDRHVRCVASSKLTRRARETLSCVTCEGLVWGVPGAAARMYEPVARPRPTLQMGPCHAVKSRLRLRRGRHSLLHLRHGCVTRWSRHGLRSGHGLSRPFPAQPLHDNVHGCCRPIPAAKARS